MARYSTIEVSKEYLKFSIAHFTIFNARERERLHGHNYSVSASFDLPVGDNGMSFNYGVLKDAVADQCDELDEYMILPEHSPYLSIEEEDEYYLVRFGDESMSFLCADTLVLPISNTTVEEFARYVLERLLEDNDWIEEEECAAITVHVSSGPGQRASADWHVEEDS